MMEGAEVRVWTHTKIQEIYGFVCIANLRFE